MGIGAGCMACKIHSCLRSFEWTYHFSFRSAPPGHWSPSRPSRSLPVPLPPFCPASLGVRSLNCSLRGAHFGVKRCYVESRKVEADSAVGLPLNMPKQHRHGLAMVNSGWCVHSEHCG